MMSTDRDTETSQPVVRRETRAVLETQEETRVITREAPDFLTPWERRLEKHGWPTLMVIIGGLVLWHVWSWVAPRLEKSFDNHNALVETIRIESPKQTEAMKDTRDAVQSTSEALKVIVPKIEDIHKRTMQRQDDK